MTQNTGPTTKSEEKRNRLYKDYSGDSPPPYPAVDNLSLGLASLPTLSNISLPSPVGSTITSPDTTPGRTSHLSPPNEAPPSIFTPRHLTISSGSSGSFPPSDLGTPDSDVPRESPDSLVEGSDKEQTTRLTNNKKSPAGAINLKRTLSDIKESPQTDSTSISGGPTSRQSLLLQPEEHDDNDQQLTFLFMEPPEAQTPGNPVPEAVPFLAFRRPSLQQAGDSKRGDASPGSRLPSAPPSVLRTITEGSAINSFDAGHMVETKRERSGSFNSHNAPPTSPLPTATSPYVIERKPFGDSQWLESMPLEPLLYMNNRDEPRPPSPLSREAALEMKETKSHPSHSKGLLSDTHNIFLFASYLATSRSFAGGYSLLRLGLQLASGASEGDVIEAPFPLYLFMALATTWGVIATKGPLSQTKGKLEKSVVLIKKLYSEGTLVRSLLFPAVLTLPAVGSLVQMGNEAVKTILTEDVNTLLTEGFQVGSWGDAGPSLEELGPVLLSMILWTFSTGTFLGNIPLYIYEQYKRDLSAGIDIGGAKWENFTWKELAQELRKELGEKPLLTLRRVWNLIGAALAVTTNVICGKEFAEQLLKIDDPVAAWFFGVLGGIPFTIMNASSVSAINRERESKTASDSPAASLTAKERGILYLLTFAASSPTIFFSTRTNLRGNYLEPVNMFLLLCGIWGAYYNVTTKYTSLLSKKRDEKEKEAKQARLEQNSAVPEGDVEVIPLTSSSSFWQCCLRRSNNNEGVPLLSPSSSASQPSARTSLCTIL